MSALYIRTYAHERNGEEQSAVWAFRRSSWAK